MQRNDSMAGLWICGNCQSPMSFEQTEQTRCTSCGLQMEWIRAQPAALTITGIERMEQERGNQV
jgi:DNA directed RNA polymerase, 7 kDa subunit